MLPSQDSLRISAVALCCDSNRALLCGFKLLEESYAYEVACRAKISPPYDQCQYNDAHKRSIPRSKDSAGVYRRRVVRYESYDESRPRRTTAPVESMDYDE